VNAQATIARTPASAAAMIQPTDDEMPDEFEGWIAVLATVSAERGGTPENAPTPLGAWPTAITDDWAAANGEVIESLW